jgi:predicted transcriptional regulator
MEGVTRVIRTDVVRRLDRIARRAGLSATALANRFLEAAVNHEERRLARDQRVIQELEAVLVRAMLHGADDGNTDAPPRRQPPPPGG